MALTVSPMAASCKAMLRAATGSAERRSSKPETSGPASWPKAKAAVIRPRIVAGLSGESERACCSPSMVMTMNVPPTRSAAIAIVSQGKPDRGQQDACGHQQVAARPNAKSIEAIEQQADQDGGDRRRNPEYRPREAEQPGVIYDLAGKGGQKGRRQYVAEAEQPVADNDAGGALGRSPGFEE